MCHSSKKFFRDNIFQNSSSVPTSSSTPHDKVWHANQVYNKWRSKKKTQVFFKQTRYIVYGLVPTNKYKKQLTKVRVICTKNFLMASNAYHRPNHVQRKDKTSASNVIVEESSNLRTIHLFHPWMIVYFKLVNIVLFLESQYIAKPIQHLKSYKSSDVVKQNQKSTRLRRLSTLSKQVHVLHQPRISKLPYRTLLILLRHQAQVLVQPVTPLLSRRQFQPTTEFDSDIPLEVYAAMELAQNDRGIALDKIDARDFGTSYKHYFYRMYH